MQKTRSPETIAEYNKHLILDALRFNGNMSRADLSRHLNMSFPAISSNAKGLLDMNYIIEVGIGENAIGRKPSLLAFNAERGYVIGVDLGRFRVRMMLADLLGNEVARTETINSAIFGGDGRQSIQLVQNQVVELLHKSGKTKDDILCIVIGVPGVMKDGVSYIAPFSEQYLERDMVETLQDAFEVDVLLENCVNLGALGEQWKGAGVDYSNITYIAYGVGLGAAHIFDGKLFTGANGAAGEIGFMITDPANIDNVYTDVGSLEETLSRSKIKKYLNAGNFDEEIQKLVQRYKDDGDTYAKLIIDEVVLNFGMTLVNMSAILNPEVIIIAGGLGTNLGRLFIDRWKEMLGRHVPFVPEVLLSELNHTETMLGAVMTGIIHIHEYEI